MSLKSIRNDHMEVTFSETKDGDILARFSTGKTISVPHKSIVRYFRDYNLWYGDITQLLMCLRYSATPLDHRSLSFSFGDHQIYFNDLTELALCVEHKYKDCPPKINSYIAFGNYYLSFEDFIKTTKYWNTPSAIVVIYDLLKLCNT